MLNPKFLVEAFAHLVKKCVAGRSPRHFQMNGERGSGRAQWPDMQIVDSGYALQLLQVFANCPWIDILRDQVKRHRERVPEQSPRAPHNYSIDDQAGDWIDP